MKQLDILVNVETSEQVGKIETYQSESTTQLFTLIIGKMDDLKLSQEEIYGVIFESLKDIKYNDGFNNYYDKHSKRVDAILSLDYAYNSLKIADLKALEELKNAIDCNLLILAQDEKLANYMLTYINDAYGFSYNENVEELLFN